MGEIRKKLDETDKKIEEELAEIPSIHKNIKYDLVRLEKLIYGLGEIIERILILNKLKLK